MFVATGRNDVGQFPHVLRHKRIWADVQQHKINVLPTRACMQSFFFGMVRENSAPHF